MKSLATLLLCFFCTQCFSQSCPLNIDFEKGDFTGWDCFIGQTSSGSGKNEINLQATAPVPGRHEIISLDSLNSKDYYGGFPQLCPYGGKYSVKLGNDDTHAEAEGISYTFTVPNLVDTFTFTYFYAVVFQDPGHAAIEQPRFFVTAYDVLSGDLINCASYDYIASSAIPGFQVSKKQGNVLYKDWSPVSIQFAGLANRQVRLEFKTADCTLSAHFGYAYLDVGEGCSNILATAPYCKETNSIILNAPYGFQSYTWFDENYTHVIGHEQSLTLSPPPATQGKFHVDMIPYPGFGCRDSADAEVIPLPVPGLPKTNDYSVCQYSFGTQLSASAERGNYLLWYDSDTSKLSTDIAPIFSTAKSGLTSYYVTQKALFGCESFRKKVGVDVIATPKASFTVNNLTQCQNGNDFIFSNSSNNLFNSRFEWDFGDGTKSTDSIGRYAYKNYGAYNISLKVENSGTCQSQVNGRVTVIPKPVAAFSFPVVVCEKQTPFTLINSSTVPNGLSYLTGWDWTIDGQKSTLQQPAVFTPDKPGDLPIALVVTTKENCASDTLYKIARVHYRPTADFSLDGNLMCNNEVIRFKNQSALPAAATGEQLTKWTWSFNSSNMATIENPALVLHAGNHTAALIAESNFGCQSPATGKNFIINPKPSISLDINDSCVFRSIRYQATDLLGTVASWHWDLGNGLFTGQNFIVKSYNVEGNQPVTLLAKTVMGCKDTVVRPFRIYDNKAFAGRDTLVAYDQPVHLNARGGQNNVYTWSPADGLDDPAIEKPVAMLNYDQRYHLDAMTKEGCDAHSDILIKRYKGPDLYIANAFTPGNDGINDVLHVFPVGILSFESFDIYNRYGQRIFHTTDFSKGWDGNFNKQPSVAGYYIAVAKAVDYRGNPMVKSVNVMLIR